MNRTPTPTPTRPRGRAGRAGARLGAALGLTAALTLGPALTAAAPAHAAPLPIGQCTTTSGAVLAVDFSRWGGPVLRSCGSTPTTGFELLNQGGWRTTGTGHDGPAFICRIGYSGHEGGRQFPPPDQDDCVLTPPATAYWSYWHADPGQNTWSYSQLGAMLYKPNPGSVDLWIFGATDIEGTRGKPTLTPDQLRAHNAAPVGGPAPQDTRTAPPPPPGTNTGPRPEHPRTPPPVEATPPASPPTASAPPSSAGPDPSTAPSASASTSAPAPGASSAAPSPTGSGPALAAGAGPKVVDAAPAADAEHDTGTLTGALATGALVLALGTVAALVAHRRRRAE
ncbi:hypothetical protein ACN20G_30080 (plasmid) [Streptomyces sp. BI20]|uniref:hypothetical protein n=1 Tax=Streptomyces sp. BI20 TaxID=3403460 RepID=UPI003C73ED5B